MDELLNPFTRLSEESNPLPFDCGFDDLNEFFKKDALKYQSKLLAVTYYLERGERTIVFFTLSNDKISAEEQKKGKFLFSNSFFRKIKDKFGREKHRNDYPAVKIGRFGVHKDFQKSENHWGTLTLDYIKNWMIANNKTGCCFLTVDAYAVAVKFYLRNGFKFMGKQEESDYLDWEKSFKKEKISSKTDFPTFAMYYNLLELLP